MPGSWTRSTSGRTVLRSKTSAAIVICHSSGTLALHATICTL